MRVRTLALYLIGNRRALVDLATERHRLLAYCSCCRLAYGEKSPQLFDVMNSPPRKESHFDASR